MLNAYLSFIKKSIKLVIKAVKLPCPFRKIQYQKETSALIAAFMVTQTHSQDNNADGKPLFKVQSFSQEDPAKEDGNHRDQVDANGGSGYRYCLDAVIIETKGTQ